MIKVRVLVIIAICCLVNACSSISNNDTTTIENLDSYQQRKTKIAQLSQWQIKGKIAFIEGKNRESANIYWQYFPKTKAQQLTLTTYLGIQVFSLTTAKGIHTLTVDGESYTDTNLTRLLTSLTGYHLPAEQLTQWLFGHAVNHNDTILFDQNNQLPITLNTQQYLHNWQVNYAHYRNEKGIFLAHKLTVKQQGLTIKLSISDWTI
ncbi:lipoprotein insertase outer membrane protein LolB [Thalassotalea sediminis]|uniref:lipoprotein insertase outer membrane protein LolB n=1 Tax=Thalassotalea sediminis TaxID=1759089 RepID=UPI00257386EC|nr:lipoprotein insertase outer membrane protein LolB [Thalassotalea sediminis]